MRQRRVRSSADVAIPCPSIVGVAEAPRPRGLAGAWPLRIALLSYRSTPTVGGQGIYVPRRRGARAAGHKVDILSGPPYPDSTQAVRLIELPSLDLTTSRTTDIALRSRHCLSLTDLMEYFGHWAALSWSRTFGRRAAKYLRAIARDYDVVLDNQCSRYGLLDIGGPACRWWRSSTIRFAATWSWPWRRSRDSGMRMLIRQWYSFLKMQEVVAPRIETYPGLGHAAMDVAALLAVRPEVMTVIPLGIDQEDFHPQPDIRRAPTVCSPPPAPMCR